MASLIFEKKTVDSMKCPVFVPEILDKSQKVDCPPPKK